MTKSVGVRIKEHLEKSLSVSGIDLVHPFPVSLYNGALDRVERFASLPRLPTFSRGDRCLGFVIGNSRAVWEPLIAWLRSHPETIELQPLDMFCQGMIETAIDGLSENIRHEARYPYDQGDRFVHFQQLARSSGFAYLDNGSNLCIHPRFGPWIGMRAVLVFDCDYDEYLAAQVAQYQGEGPLDRECPKECKEAAEKLMTAFAAHAKENPMAWKSEWSRLVEVRDALGNYPLAIKNRYSQEQVLYHYTKDRMILHRLVNQKLLN